MKPTTYTMVVKHLLDYHAHKLIDNGQLYRGLRRARKSLEKTHG